MAARENHVTTVEVTQMVDSFIDAEHRADTQYSNRTALDESGSFSLHRLAAEIYALGFAEGQRVELFRKTNERLRNKPEGSA